MFPLLERLGQKDPLSQEVKASLGNSKTPLQRGKKVKSNDGKKHLRFHQGTSSHCVHHYQLDNVIVFLEVGGEKFHSIALHKAVGFTYFKS